MLNRETVMWNPVVSFSNKNIARPSLFYRPDYAIVTCHSLGGDGVQCNYSGFPPCTELALSIVNQSWQDVPTDHFPRIVLTDKNGNAEFRFQSDMKSKSTFFVLVAKWEFQSHSNTLYSPPFLSRTKNFSKRTDAVERISSTTTNHDFAYNNHTGRHFICAVESQTETNKVEHLMQFVRSGSGKLGKRCYLDTYLKKRGEKVETTEPCARQYFTNNDHSKSQEGGLASQQPLTTTSEKVVPEPYLNDQILNDFQTLSHKLVCYATELFDLKSVKSGECDDYLRQYWPYFWCSINNTKEGITTAELQQFQQRLAGTSQQQQQQQQPQTARQAVPREAETEPFQERQPLSVPPQAPSDAAARGFQSPVSGHLVKKASGLAISIPSHDGPNSTTTTPVTVVRPFDCNKYDQEEEVEEEERGGYCGGGTHTPCIDSINSIGRSRSVSCSGNGRSVIFADSSRDDHTYTSINTVGTGDPPHNILSRSASLPCNLDHSRFACASTATAVAASHDGNTDAMTPVAAWRENRSASIDSVYSTASSTYSNNTSPRTHTGTPKRDIFGSPRFRGQSVHSNNTHQNDDMLLQQTQTVAPDEGVNIGGLCEATSTICNNYVGNDAAGSTIAAVNNVSRDDLLTCDMASNRSKRSKSVGGDSTEWFFEQVNVNTTEKNSKNSSCDSHRNPNENTGQMPAAQAHHRSISVPNFSHRRKYSKGDLDLSLFNGFDQVENGQQMAPLLVDRNHMVSPATVSYVPAGTASTVVAAVVCPPIYSNRSSSRQGMLVPDSLSRNITLSQETTSDGGGASGFWLSSSTSAFRPATHQSTKASIGRRRSRRKKTQEQQQPQVIITTNAVTTPDGDDCRMRQSGDDFSQLLHVDSCGQSSSNGCNKDGREISSDNVTDVDAEVANMFDFDCNLDFDDLLADLQSEHDDNNNDDDLLTQLC